jgi:DNA topoisomerase IA
MTVIIAEKPSLARNIVEGIQQKDKCSLQKKNGYFEGGGYLVTWAFGHLFSLCDIEDYTGKDPSARWSLDGLPCFPEKFISIGHPFNLYYLYHLLQLYDSKESSVCQDKKPKITAIFAVI